MTTSPHSPPAHILGVDTGGTFTDFVWLNCHTGELKAHKVLSTPDNPAQAIFNGIEQLGLSQFLASGQVQIIHGSTVATNAALERKGVKTALVTNKGIGDLLTIGRQTRPHLYQLQPQPSTPPVPSELCFEVNCRLNADGDTITSLSDEAIEQLRQVHERTHPAKA